MKAFFKLDRITKTLATFLRLAFHFGISCFKSNNVIFRTNIANVQTKNNIKKKRLVESKRTC